MTGRGVPVRPVPYYLFYATDDMNHNTGKLLSGNVNTGDELGHFREMRVFDIDGMPIDPAAMLSVLSILVLHYPSLMWLPQIAADATAGNGVTAVARSASGVLNGGPITTRVRLCDHAGTPVTDAATNFSGLTAVNATAGIYQVTNVPSTINRQGSLSNRVVFGSAHGGTLGAAFAVPQWQDQRGALVGTIADPATFALAMYRDFYSLRVIDMDSFLLGTPPTGFANANGVALEQPPQVRMNETLNLLANGNEVLAAAGDQIPAAPNQSQIVAQSIQPTQFTVPTGAGANTLWPALSSGGTGPQQLNPGLVNGLTFTAQYIVDTTATPVTTPNIALTIAGLPGDVAVRVYPRRFVDDEREARGDGDGAIVPPGGGTVTLILFDPFGLLRSVPQKPIPTSAILRFDMMVVSDQLATPTGPLVKRLYGNIDLTINSASTVNDTALPAPTAGNAFANNPPGVNMFRGTSRSEIIDRRPNAFIDSPIAGPANLVDLLNNLVGVEAGADGITPREHTRLPTMACRDLVVSTFNAGVISGGRLDTRAVTGQSRLGAPGSRWGLEHQSAGVGAQGGQLAYDLARLALRRSQYMPLSLVNILPDAWNLPAVGTGTFAGAVLQNTAPLVEMPNLFYLKDDMNAFATARAGWTAANRMANLFNWITTTLDTKTVTVEGQNIPVQLLSGQLNDVLNTINTNITNPGLVTNQTTARDRVYAELERRLVSAVYGRRDTEWALTKGINHARRFIYIESPGLCSTRLDSNGAPASDDLLNVIANRVMQVPTLRVVICIPRFPDYPESVPDFIQYELADRANRLLSLTAGRVRVFHPIGFPGRPVRLDTTTVVVDDVWALIGSSTLRRRGLSFDASSDLVLTDTVYERGHCPAIAEFRRRLMASRLGLAATEGNMTQPSYARLRDGVEAYEVVDDMLQNGGAGRIEPLYERPDPNFDPSDWASKANPDGATVANDPQLWSELWAIANLLMG